MTQRSSGEPLRSEVDIAALVEIGRVHSRVYTDPAIFQLELERIFHSTWVYVGHASEVPAVGDYRLRTIGRQPVIMVHGVDEKIHVFMNRCRHRGTVVCETEAGSTKLFRCWYHGWTYNTAGKLVGVPGREAYGENFEQGSLGLTSAPRVDSYRGMIFASLAAHGESLLDHLGLATPAMDLLFDASPAGEILVDAGVHKTVFRGNWKLVGMDGYHPHFVHASVIEETRRKPAAGTAATHGNNPFDDRSSSRTRDLLKGHVMLDVSGPRLGNYEKYTAYLANVPGGEQYISALKDVRGEARARMLIAMAADPHLGLFPNLQLINNQIRIITPLAADRTEVMMFPVRLQAVSDELNQLRLRQHESFFGPAGHGSPDDAEIFERVQKGLMAEVEPWVDLSRGLARQQTEADGTIAGLISDEVPQRGQMRRWRQLMSQTP